MAKRIADVVVKKNSVTITIDLTAIKEEIRQEMLAAISKAGGSSGGNPKKRATRKAGKKTAKKAAVSGAKRGRRAGTSDMPLLDISYPSRMKVFQYLAKNHGVTMPDMRSNDPSVAKIKGFARKMSGKEWLAAMKRNAKIPADASTTGPKKKVPKKAAKKKAAKQIEAS